MNAYVGRVVERVDGKLYWNDELWYYVKFVGINQKRFIARRELHVADEKLTEFMRRCSQDENIKIDIPSVLATDAADKQNTLKSANDMQSIWSEDELDDEPRFAPDSADFDSYSDQQGELEASSASVSATLDSDDDPPQMTKRQRQEELIALLEEPGIDFRDLESDELTRYSAQDGLSEADAAAEIVTRKLRRRRRRKRREIRRQVEERRAAIFERAQGAEGELASPKRHREINKESSGDESVVPQRRRRVIFSDDE